MAVDRWTARLRMMAFREAQVLGSLESHRRAASESLKGHYAYPVSLARRRLELLEGALARRGAGPGRFWVGVFRSAGRITGRLTGWGPPARTLASDIEGVRRLGDSYLAEYRASPPSDISMLLVEFLRELEAEHCALVAELRRRRSS